MAASGQLARGTTLKVTISATPTEIPANNPIGSSKSKPAIDITGLNDGDAQSVAAGIQTAEYTFTINYDRTNAVHAYLEDSHEGNIVEAFVLTQADTDTDTFNGHVTGFDKTFDKDDVQKATVTVTRSGASTLSA